MRYTQRTVPIPADVVATLSAVPIRRLHRLGVKSGAFPAHYTELLFRKIWRIKAATPTEIEFFQRLAALVAAQPAELPQGHIAAQH